MDLLKFEGGDLYFDDEDNESVTALLDEAANNYGRASGDIVYSKESETLLLRAAAISPTNLSVLVGLYRFYYYQHRYENALQVAYRVLEVIGKKVSFPECWNDLTLDHMGFGAMYSMQMVRFYLFALKGIAYLNLRLKRIPEAREILDKIVDLDKADRIGAQQLLALISACEPTRFEKKTLVAEEV